MRTMKLPYTVEGDQVPIFRYLLGAMRREQSVVIRSSYCRGMEGQSELLTRTYCRDLCSWVYIDSWFLQSGVLKGMASAKATIEGEGGITIFGGRPSWTDYQKGLITRDEFRANRVLPLACIGEAARKGNRKFEINLDRREVHFKPASGCNFVLRLPYIRDNYFRQLRALEEISKRKEVPYLVELTDTHVHISCEEGIYAELDAYCPGKKLRMLGYDLNPNGIGWMVLERQGSSDRVVASGIYDLTKLNLALAGLPSTDPAKVYQTHKREHEVMHISRDLERKARHYCCSGAAGEDLDMLSKDHEKGTRYNQLVNNMWLRRPLADGPLEPMEWKGGNHSGRIHGMG